MLAAIVLFGLIFPSPLEPEYIGYLSVLSEATVPIANRMGTQYYAYVIEGHP